MHAGQFAALEQVVRHYIEAPHAVVGHSELTHRHERGTDSTHPERAPIELTAAEVADLVSFLGTLSTERESTSAAP
jgi:cytochrome c peroxidase